jgi:NRPS condensation-like uncharacterized protein
MMHLVITLDGYLDAPRVCRAMMLVMEAEPLLACRFVESPTPYWEWMPDLHRDSVFSLIQCGDTDAALREVLITRLDPSKGPQARLTLLRGAADSLVISVNHAASDACGVKHICGLLVMAYRALGHDTGFSLPRAFHRDRSFTPLLSTLCPQARTAALEAFGEQSAVWGIPCQAGVQGSPVYRCRVIRPSTFLEAKAYSRSHGVTMNDLLLAAFFAAICQEIPHRSEQHYPVLTSADLRRSVPGGEAPAVANLSVAFEVWFPADKAPFGEDLVREVHHIMDGKKRLLAGIGSAIRLEEAFSAGFHSMRAHLLELERCSLYEHYPKNPFFSNTGIIPPECVDFRDVRTMHAFILPPVEYSPGFGIAASTFQNTLTLASGFCEGPLPYPMVERILSSMEEFISTLPGK